MASYQYCRKHGDNGFFLKVHLMDDSIRVIFNLNHVCVFFSPAEFYDLSILYLQEKYIGYWYLPQCSVGILNG